MPMSVELVRVANATNSTFALEFRARLGSVPIAASIGASELALEWRGQTLGHAALPPMELAASHNGSTLASKGQFTIAPKNITWTLAFDARAKVAGISLPMTRVSRTLKLAAFDRFTERRIVRFGVNGTAPHGAGVRIYCTSDIVNPTAFALTLNEPEFDLLAPGDDGSLVHVGSVRAPIIAMVRGNQSILFDGTLGMGVATSNTSAAAIGRLLSSSLRGSTNSPDGVLTLRGRSARGVGGAYVPWLDELMSHFELTEHVPPLPDPKPLRDVRFTDVMLHFSETTPVIFANITAEVSFFVPPQFAFAFSLERARMQLAMRFANATAGQLDVPWTPVRTLAAPTRVAMTANNVQLNYNAEPLAEMLVAAFNARSMNVSSVGHSWAEFSSAIAPRVELSNVPFATTVPLRGADAFRGGLSLHDIELVGSQATTASLSAHILLVNNASISAATGTFTLGVYARGVYVGNATAVNPTIRTGVNHFKVHGYVVQTPTNHAERQWLLSRYATGVATDVELRGSAAGTQVALLRRAFGQLRSPTIFPGLVNRGGLVRGAELLIDWDHFSAAGRLLVHNPLGVAITVTATNLNITYNNTLLGAADATLQPPVTTPPHNTVETRAIDVRVDLGWTDISVFYSLLCRNTTTVDVAGTLSFRLDGGYSETDLPYHQTGVPIAVGHLPGHGGISIPCP